MILKDEGLNENRNLKKKGKNPLLCSTHSDLRSYFPSKQRKASLFCCVTQPLPISQPRSCNLFHCGVTNDKEWLWYMQRIKTAQFYGFILLKCPSPMTQLSKIVSCHLSYNMAVNNTPQTKSCIICYNAFSLIWTRIKKNPQYFSLL